MTEHFRTRTPCSYDGLKGRRGLGQGLPPARLPEGLRKQAALGPSRSARGLWPRAAGLGLPLDGGLVSPGSPGSLCTQQHRGWGGLRAAEAPCLLDPGHWVLGLEACFPLCWWQRHLNPALDWKRHLFHFLLAVPSGNTSLTEHTWGLRATSCVTP